MARAWCLYTETQALRNPAGLIVSQLERGARPPGEFVALAGISSEDWAWLVGPS